MSAQAFLDWAGWQGATSQPLAGDASTRRYHRITRDGRTAILMACPGDPSLAPFLEVATWLRAIGLVAPAVLAVDHDAGLALIQDLGDALVDRVLDAGGDATTIYRTAGDVLRHAQAHPPPATLPALDEAALLALLDLFLEHGAPGAPAEAAASFRTVWTELLASAQLGPPVFVHRDYHVANLVWHPEARGLARLGLLDFQDAHCGPALYDVVSLAEDARRDVAPEIAAELRQGYAADHPELVPEAVDIAWTVLGAQRAMRILAVLERLASVRGKASYRTLKPRVLAHLRRHLAHPAMVPLRQWCRVWYPAA